MWETVTIGDFITVAVILGGAWRLFQKLEQSLAVNDAKNEERHSYTKTAIEDLSDRVKEQNGRVGKAESAIAEIRGELRR